MWGLKKNMPDCFGNKPSSKTGGWQQTKISAMETAVSKLVGDKFTIF